MAYDEKELVNEPQYHENIRYFNITNMPLFFGIAVFNFEGNGVILNLKASMKEPEKFAKIQRNIMITVITLLVFFGCFSYESFGERIKDMVTMNLPHNNLTSAVQMFYCFGLLGSYPMQVLPAIDITEKTQAFINSANPFKDINPYIKNIVLRTLLVLFTGMLAVVIPKFGLFINLTGAFSCTALAFILPVLMYNKVAADDLTPRRKQAHYAILAFGIICGTISFIMSLREIVQAFSEGDENQPETAN